MTSAGSRLPSTRLICVPVALLCLAATPEMIPLESADPVGRTAPDVELTLADGRTVKLSERRGRPVVLSFWASWCGPCRKELPALADLAKARKEVTFLAVNVDKERAAAQRFFQELNVDLPVAFDAEALAMGKFDVLSMPTMFLLDKNGTVKFRKSGFSVDKGLGELIAALDGLR